MLQRIWSFLGSVLGNSIPIKMDFMVGSGSFSERFIGKFGVDPRHHRGHVDFLKYPFGDNLDDQHRPLTELNAAVYGWWFKSDKRLANEDAVEFHNAEEWSKVIQFYADEFGYNDLSDGDLKLLGHAFADNFQHIRRSAINQNIIQPNEENDAIHTLRLLNKVLWLFQQLPEDIRKTKAAKSLKKDLFFSLLIHDTDEIYGEPATSVASVHASEENHDKLRPVHPPRSLVVAYLHHRASQLQGIGDPTKFIQKVNADLKYQGRWKTKEPQSLKAFEKALGVDDSDEILRILIGTDPVDGAHISQSNPQKTLNNNKDPVDKAKTLRSISEKDLALAALVKFIDRLDGTAWNNQTAELAFRLFPTVKKGQPYDIDGLEKTIGYLSKSMPPALQKPRPLSQIGRLLGAAFVTEVHTPKPNRLETDSDIIGFPNTKRLPPRYEGDPYEQWIAATTSLLADAKNRGLYSVHDALKPLLKGEYERINDQTYEVAKRVKANHKGIEAFFRQIANASTTIGPWFQLGGAGALAAALAAPAEWQAPLMLLGKTSVAFGTLATMPAMWQRSAIDRSVVGLAAAGFCTRVAYEMLLHPDIGPAALIFGNAVWSISRYTAQANPADRRYPAEFSPSGISKHLVDETKRTGEVIGNSFTHFSQNARACWRVVRTNKGKSLPTGGREGRIRDTESIAQFNVALWTAAVITQLVALTPFPIANRLDIAAQIATGFGNAVEGMHHGNPGFTFAGLGSAIARAVLAGNVTDNPQVDTAATAGLFAGFGGFGLGLNRANNKGQEK
jgi:hypothetical protein